MPDTLCFPLKLSPQWAFACSLEDRLKVVEVLLLIAAYGERLGLSKFFSERRCSMRGSSQSSLSFTSESWGPSFLWVSTTS